MKIGSILKCVNIFNVFEKVSEYFEAAIYIIMLTIVNGSERTGRENLENKIENAIVISNVKIDAIIIIRIDLSVILKKKPTDIPLRTGLYT